MDHKAFTGLNYFLSWLEDRHKFSGEARLFGVGTRVKDAPEKGARPS